MTALVLGALYLRAEGYISPETVVGFLGEHRTLAPVLFIVLYSILPSLLVTTIPMTIGAGFLWGPLWGAALSVTGATIGFSVSFLISRYLAGDYFRTRFNNSLWKRLMEHVDRGGWKVVAFTRINPIFPATVVSYMFGVTSIRFSDYLWSTFVFFVPPSIAMASFGSSLGNFVLTGDAKGIATGLAVASVAMLLMFALKPLAGKLLPVGEKADS